MAASGGLRTPILSQLKDTSPEGIQRWSQDLIIQLTRELILLNQRAETLDESMNIISGIIGEDAIANGAITNLKIADLAVSTGKIQDAAIEAAKIKDATITAAKIQDAEITGAKIALATIEGANIKDAAISSAKIGDLQVKSANIDNLTVGTQKITNFAVIRGVFATPSDQSSFTSTSETSIGSVSPYCYTTGDTVRGLFKANVNVGYYTDGKNYYRPAIRFRIRKGSASGTIIETIIVGGAGGALQVEDIIPVTGLWVDQPGVSSQYQAYYLTAQVIVSSFSSWGVNPAITTIKMDAWARSK
jgi:hypothetical protein